MCVYIYIYVYIKAFVDNVDDMGRQPVYVMYIGKLGRLGTHSYFSDLTGYLT